MKDQYGIAKIVDLLYKGLKYVQKRIRRRFYLQPFYYVGLGGTFWTCFNCKTQNEGNICWICKNSKEVASKLPATLVCKG